MPSVRRGEIAIEYVTHGDPSGLPLLLLTGLGGQLSDWPDGFLEALVAEGFFVITPDNRDSGLSTQVDATPPARARFVAAVLARRPIQHAYLLGDMADDFLGVLDELALDRVHVAGISMGGMLSQEFTIRYPERVRSMCSIKSTTGNPKVGGATMRTIMAMARYGGRPRSKAVDSSVALFRQFSGPRFDAAEHRKIAERSVARSYTPDGTLRQLAAILSSPDRTTALGRVVAPTLVIHGVLDPLVKVSGGIATAQAVPGSRLVMFDDMAHDLPRPRWRQIAEEMRLNAQR